jgi:hypothetical protein
MLATMLTYFTSAFWHVRTTHKLANSRVCRVCVVFHVSSSPATNDQGFYPGYFMFFLMGAVLTETGKSACAAVPCHACRAVSCRVVGRVVS